MKPVTGVCECSGLRTLGVVVTCAAMTGLEVSTSVESEEVTKLGFSVASVVAD